MLRIATILVVLLGTGLTARAEASAWSLAGDFSITNNPNGAWTYGYKVGTGGTFTRYAGVTPAADLDNLPAWGTSTRECPNLWQNTRTYIVNYTAPGQVALHPGPYGEISIARWTAPTTAQYGFNVEILPGDPGTGSSSHDLSEPDVYVWRGSSLLYQDQSLRSPLYFSQSSLLLNAGETLDFAVGAHNGDWAWNTTPFIVDINAVPEPATLSLLGLGLAGLLAHRKRAAAGR